MNDVSISSRPDRTRTVYEALADALCQVTPSPLFALMGDANQELIVAIADRGRQVIEGRHEQNVVAMADGYARFTGQIGLCTVTQGPGLTNAGTSLAVADRGHSPVLLLAGQTARGDFNNPQRLDQMAFASATAVAASADSPRALDAALARALAHFASGGGAFVLNLPTDVQNAALDEPLRAHQSAKPSAFVPGSAAINQALDLMRRAQRPAILAGGGAIDAQNEIVGLAELLGAPIAGTLKAKGLANGHPLSVGVSGGLGDPGASAMLKQADLILAVGAGLNAWTTSFGENVDHCPMVQIDHSPAAFGQHTKVDLALVGDSALTLAALQAQLKDLRRQCWWSEKPARSAKIYQDGADGKPDPRRVLDIINRNLPPDRIVVADGGHCVQATCQEVQVTHPRNWTYSFDFGCIGQGLGLAIGACIARPSRRVTLITGDASLLMNLGDLDTAVRSRLSLTIIVLNDDGFGQERHALARKGLSPDLAMLKAPDFVKLAAAVGGAGRCFSSVSELDWFEAALKDAQVEDRLQLFDVLINGDVELDVSSEIARHLR
jgi:thiamine pyrophosphate-dependent acetolactate synthase large subunit-like protein